jgi:predicted phosphodiesterase
MAKLAQFRDPDLSLFQSALDEVLFTKAAAAHVHGAPAGRPDLSNAMVQQIAALGGEASQAKPAFSKDIGGTVSYCASLARNYAVAKLEGRTNDADQYYALLTQKMGDCDPDWAETAIKYAEFLASKKPIPYRTHQALSDFVIDGKLPDKARIALVGDWGTGQQDAKTVLSQIASKNPDVVIHMGDIYYSATDFEVQNYFYQIWQGALNLSKVATYTLSGNHDMFSGGAAYYSLLDKLGQPASYFCLRNDNWQFIALDTGFYDSKPGGTDPTYLHDTEVQWLTDKIQNSGGRRTVLLSHHQLFAAFEDICGKSSNATLNGQLSSLLPNVDIWFWGHEHNLVIYQKYMGVLARCIGHGAFPIGVEEIPRQPKFPEVPVQNILLGNNGVFFNHGYAIVDLAGGEASIAYYQDSDETNPQFTETLSLTNETASPPTQAALQSMK